MNLYINKQPQLIPWTYGIPGPHLIPGPSLVAGPKPYSWALGHLILGPHLIPDPRLVPGLSICIPRL